MSIVYIYFYRQFGILNEGSAHDFRDVSTLVALLFW